MPEVMTITSSTVCTFIFTTGLPPVNIAWTLFVDAFGRLQEQRKHQRISAGRFAKACRYWDTPAPAPAHRPDDYRAEVDTVLKAGPCNGMDFTPCQCARLITGRNVAHPFFADKRISKEIEELKKRTENLK